MIWIKNYKAEWVNLDKAFFLGVRGPINDTILPKERNWKVYARFLNSDVPDVIISLHKKEEEAKKELNKLMDEEVAAAFKVGDDFE